MTIPRKLCLWTLTTLDQDVSLPSGEVLPAGTEVMLVPQVAAHDVLVEDGKSLAELWPTLSQGGHAHETRAATISTAWTGSAPPYTQNITVDGVTQDSIVDVALAATATAEQVAQYQALNWTDGGQDTNQITLRAWGDKNTVDIPVTVVVGR